MSHIQCIVLPWAGLRHLMQVESFLTHIHNFRAVRDCTTKFFGAVEVHMLFRIKSSGLRTVGQTADSETAKPVILAVVSTWPYSTSMGCRMSWHIIYRDFLAWGLTERYAPKKGQYPTLDGLMLRNPRVKEWQQAASSVSVRRVLIGPKTFCAQQGYLQASLSPGTVVGQLEEGIPMGHWASFILSITAFISLPCPARTFLWRAVCSLSARAARTFLWSAVCSLYARARFSNTPRATLSASLKSVLWQAWQTFRTMMVALGSRLLTTRFPRLRSPLYATPNCGACALFIDMRCLPCSAAQLQLGNGGHTPRICTGFASCWLPWLPELPLSWAVASRIESRTSQGSIGLACIPLVMRQTRWCWGATWSAMLLRSTGREFSRKPPSSWSTSIWESDHVRIQSQYCKMHYNVVTIDCNIVFIVSIVNNGLQKKKSL